MANWNIYIIFRAQKFIKPVNNKTVKVNFEKFENLAYTLSVLFDKLMILNGRPTNITASANVKLGASDMTPDKVRSILKGAKKATENLPKEASNEKVIEVSDEKNG